MIRIKFKNDLGEFSMGGGHHEAMNITSLSGFGIPPREMTNINFAGQSGTTTTNIKDNQRIITIGGDFYGSPQKIEKIYKILHKKGTLSCRCGSQDFQIECFAINNDDFMEYGKSGFYKFVLQFQADNPYFTDKEQKKYAIYKRVDKIGTPFTLPAVFTERITSTSVIVGGDMSIYPIINIEAQSPSGNYGQFTIKNNTTGSFIVINHQLKQGEKITVDIPNRKIVSNIDGIITNQISDETVLSNFMLVQGENNISVDKTNANDVFYAEIIYKNLYVSAVQYGY